MKIKSYFELYKYDSKLELDNYRLMLFIRRFEQKLLEQFSQGKIFGTTHTSIGQEANAVGVIRSLDLEKDTVWSNHRCHGHYLAYSGDALGLFSEILGKKQGVCAGRGGSQHLARKNFFSSGIQGGLAPIAVGTALADKNQGGISVVFLGDGTMGEGAVYESLNMASLWKAPVLFVVEDNGIAQSTEKKLGVSGDIADRARPFFIKSKSISTTDIRVVLKESQSAIQYVRDCQMPFWLHIETTRLMAHSKGDDTRDLKFIAELWENDCLQKVAPEKTTQMLLDKEIEECIDNIFEAALTGEDA
jgi:TPP-dependent pyruvate/acetoin dehydrogenase alpha subunit